MVVDMYMKSQQTGTNCGNHVVLVITLSLIDRYRLNQSYIKKFILGIYLIYTESYDLRYEFIEIYNFPYKSLIMQIYVHTLSSCIILDEIFKTLIFLKITLLRKIMI